MNLETNDTEYKRKLTDGLERELEAERASLVGDQKLPKGCPKDAQRI